MYLVESWQEKHSVESDALHLLHQLGQEHGMVLELVTSKINPFSHISTHTLV